MTLRVQPREAVLKIRGGSAAVFAVVVLFERWTCGSVPHGDRGGRGTRGLVPVNRLVRGCCRIGCDVYLVMRWLLGPLEHY